MCQSWSFFIIMITLLPSFWLYLWNTHEIQHILKRNKKCLPDAWVHRERPDYGTTFCIFIDSSVGYEYLKNIVVVFVFFLHLCSIKDGGTNEEVIEYESAENYFIHVYKDWIDLPYCVCSSTRKKFIKRWNIINCLYIIILAYIYFRYKYTWNLFKCFFSKIDKVFECAYSLVIIWIKV